MPIEFVSYTEGFKGPRYLPPDTKIENLWSYVDRWPPLDVNTNDMLIKLLPKERFEIHSEFPKTRIGHAVKLNRILVGTERIFLYPETNPELKKENKILVPIDEIYLKVYERGIDVIRCEDEDKKVNFYYGFLRYTPKKSNS
jgi:hypothetical protein